MDLLISKIKNWNFFILLIALLSFATKINAQNKWQPDSTAYHYLCRGNNPGQFKSSGLTSISQDNIIHNSNPSSIRWDIPANSGMQVLNLLTGDIDLRKLVLYAVCRRNNIPNKITIYVNTKAGTKFLIGGTTVSNSIQFSLPPTEWHQTGGYVEGLPQNNANTLDLQHVNSISFESPNANVDVSLWIDEIKTIAPTGPACVINFNRFRSNADSLLVPYMLSKNIKGNIDFVFSLAKTKLTETNFGLTYNYIGLSRIDTLVHLNKWSCSSHGSYYARLPRLSAADQYRLCALDSFTNNGFDVHWCLGIPHDDCTNAIFKKIKDWNFYKTIRKQDQGFNELPIDNPYYLRFFRPTSASAGSNVGGVPLSPQQMKGFVDSIQNNKGLLIVDIGSILLDSSSLYGDSELTMQRDAYQLIDYADSLNIPFLTFEDLFKPDSLYSQKLNASDDYFVLTNLNSVNLNVQLNDVAPNLSTITLNILSSPQNGTANVNGAEINYTPLVQCFVLDSLVYTISNGTITDTAKVFIQRWGSNIETIKTNYCNPNSFSLVVTPIGGKPNYSYLWSDGNTSKNRSFTGATTLYLTITDASGCIVNDSITLTNTPKPKPIVTDSIQCGAGIPLCSVISNGTILWYDSLANGTLLQTGGNTFNTIVNSTTTFYVAADYGTCISNRVPVKTTFDKPAVQISTSDTSFCPRSYVRLDAVTDIDLSFQWYKDGVAIPTSAISDFYYARKTGYYNLQVTRNSDGCVNTSDSIYISAIDTPSISTNGNYTFCFGDSITLSLPVINSGNYSWFQNNIAIGNANNSNLTIFTAGNYFGKIVYPQGCNLNSDTITAIVNCTVGINQIKNPSFTCEIIPNPSTGDARIIITNEKPQPISIIVTSLDGKNAMTIADEIIGIGDYEYSLGNLSSGIYICNIKTESKSYLKKFVVIH